MKSVILIAMPEDQARVRNIVGALNESNLDVYWDRTDQESDNWLETAERAFSARAVVLFLSSAALRPGGERYRTLGEQCVARGNALCVLIDDVELPDAFKRCTTYDLRGWRSRASSLFMLDLVAGVKAKGAGLDPPMPRAARHLLLQRLYIAVPSAIAALALLAGLYHDVGADQIASPAEASAWSALRPNSCDDLRNFLSAHRNGVHAQEAQALLASRRLVQHETPSFTSRPLPLYVSAGAADPSAGAAAARTAADQRAGAEAKRLCEGLAEATSSKLLDAKAQLTEHECDAANDGARCSAGGQAICVLKEPEAHGVEVCGSAR